MDRREFITWIGVGGLAASLPVAIAACNPDPDTATAPAEPTDTPADAPADAPADVPAAGGAETVGTLTELDADGQILNKTASVGPVFVVRQPDNPDAIIAVNPTCTHQGCDVDWKGDQGLFVCPCHSSQFTPDGAVVQGPAGRPLDTYTVELDGDSILVSPA